MAALGQRQTGRASSPKRTVREETVWLFLTPTTASRAAQRATLDHLKLRAHQPWAHRCWLFDTDQQRHPGRSAAQSRDRKTGEALSFRGCRAEPGIQNR
jgi:hypothetical protein